MGTYTFSWQYSCFTQTFGPSIGSFRSSWSVQPVLWVHNMLKWCYCQQMAPMLYVCWSYTITNCVWLCYVRVQCIADHDSHLLFFRVQWSGLLQGWSGILHEWNTLEHLNFPLNVVSLSCGCVLPSFTSKVIIHN